MLQTKDVQAIKTHNFMFSNIFPEIRFSVETMCKNMAQTERPQMTEVFPCFFLSCKAIARVKLAKTGHGPHSSTLVVICVVQLLFLLFYVLFVCKCVLPPGDNPIAVNIYIIQEMKTWTE